MFRTQQRSPLSRSGSTICGLSSQTLSSSKCCPFKAFRPFTNSCAIMAWNWTFFCSINSSQSSFFFFTLLLILHFVIYYLSNFIFKLNFFFCINFRENYENYKFCCERIVKEDIVSKKGGGAYGKSYIISTSSQYVFYEWLLTQTFFLRFDLFWKTRNCQKFAVSFFLRRFFVVYFCFSSFFLFFLSFLEI